MQYKRIKLTFYREPDEDSIYTQRQKYRVYYADSKFKYFESKKACDEFLFDFSAFLTNKLYQAQEKQILIYSIFIKYFAYLEMQIIEQLKGSFSANEKLIYRILFQKSFLLGNADKTTCLIKICNNLLYCCSIIKDRFSKSQILIYYELSRIELELKEIIQDIDNY